MQLAGRGVNNCSAIVGNDCDIVGKCEGEVPNTGLGVNYGWDLVVKIKELLRRIFVCVRGVHLMGVC